MTPVREVRFVFVVDDFDAVVRLYRDVFGLEARMDLEGDGGRGVILELPAATIELADQEHGRIVDGIELGRPSDGRIRIAIEVDKLEDAAVQVTEAGAEPLAEPVETPWGDRNQRFRDPDGLQLTLYQPP